MTFSYQRTSRIKTKMRRMRYKVRMVDQFKYRLISLSWFVMHWGLGNRIVCWDTNPHLVIHGYRDTLPCLDNKLPQYSNFDSCHPNSDTKTPFSDLLSEQFYLDPSVPGQWDWSSVDTERQHEFALNSRRSVVMHRLDQREYRRHLSTQFR